MEKELNELRNQINDIDDKIKELYLKRMQIVFQISNIKQKNNLPVEDLKREKELIDSINNSNDEIIKDYYQEVLNALLKTSKDYQKKLRSN